VLWRGKKKGFQLLDLSVNLTERKLSKNASLKKWLCIKIWSCLKTVEILSFPPAKGGGKDIIN
jgi:hypothetical protein